MNEFVPLVQFVYTNSVVKYIKIATKILVLSYRKYYPVWLLMKMIHKVKI